MDLNLNTFRCTYTVGKEELALGKINSECDKLNIFNKHGLLNSEQCLECKLDRYCSGGCYLSYNANRDRQCEEEKMNFDNLIIPLLKN
ncbi:SPASM domain-containing protein [Clostridium sp.]|uniref:SPASM domain-containing protein n=1 Tax=Clostridium sp. TaxID=1506 RepID=UPI0039C5F873